MVGFEKALVAVKVIKDQIQYRSQSLLNLARGYFSCSQNIYDLFLSFLHNFGFSKVAFCRLHDECWGVNLEGLGLDTLSNTGTSKPCIISKHGLVVYKFNILLS